MDTLFSTSFSDFWQKAARGEGGQESTAQKVSEKALFFMVFRIRLFLSIQAALGRGFGRFCSYRHEPGKGVLEDTFSTATAPIIWLLPRLFPQRDSRYHTPPVPS